MREHKGNSSKGHTWIAFDGHKKTTKAKCPKCQTVRRVYPNYAEYILKDGSVVRESPVCDNSFKSYNDGNIR